MKRFILLYAFFCVLSLCVVSCTKDCSYEQAGEIGDGECTVSATVSFRPLKPALNGNTRAAGDAIKSIESLCVLLYDEEGILLEKYPLSEGGENGYELSECDRTQETHPEMIDGTKRDLPSSESATPSAKFRLKIPYGRYYIYAVANMGDLAAYDEEIGTVNGLKSISLGWNADDVSANDQMFGYFTVKGGEQSGELTTVNSPKMSLQAWVRRAASKVTVAYDGSNLEENVFIYLKSVQIKDIPAYCYLGKENAVKAESGENGEKFLLSGETIVYSRSEDYRDWPRLSKGKPYYGSSTQASVDGDNEDNVRLVDYHREDTPALYFYENMQGIATNSEKHKLQDADGDGILDAPGKPGDDTYVDKDGRPYGTYIEVEAYYKSNHRDLPGEGRIIYRFMLGKNVTDDFNAERNHHYKLTLKFNRFANNIDWHIDYDEPKGIHAPNPYYISYLYNNDMQLPLKLTGTNITDLQIEIVENGWGPDEPRDDFDYYTGTVLPSGTCNGFLSLAKTTDKIVGLNEAYNSQYNRTYWNAHPTKGKRRYDTGEGEHADPDGNYTVTKVDGGIVVMVPFYTRAKQLVPRTGFTGNNPYVAYRRKAVVRVSAKFDGEPITKDIVIHQVRRVVNPKGIWRRWDNDAEFHVILKTLPYESANSFEAIESDGPWSAEVEVGADWIKINGVLGGKASGSTDTAIDFKFQPDGICASENDIRCGIILVKYNDYTCHHRILVRQGYAPMMLDDENVKWHTFNMYDGTHETDSPLEEGSMFKFGNWDDAILATNNYRPGFGFGENPGQNLFDLAGGGGKSWNNIKAYKGENQTPSVSASFPEVTLEGSDVRVRVATIEEYGKLRDAVDREFAYGILYGDGATETQDDIEMAYGYVRGGDQRCGMRGCFVYNTTTGNNLFFPVGASGYGRRKTDYAFSDEPEYAGTLRYANRTKVYKESNQLQYRPLFYDVYMRPGAVYWCKDIVRKSDGGLVSEYAAWDVNYFTFDFNGFDTTSALGSRSDPSNQSSACFIRCVEDVSSTDR